MVLHPLYDPSKGQMRIAGLMSGSGSNLRKIIEFEHTLQQERGIAPFHLALIFSDRYNSNAALIGKDHDLPVIIRDIAGFYKKKGRPFRDLEARAEFDADTAQRLTQEGIRIAAFGGYMSIATAPLTNTVLCVNVHPADLRLMNGDKRRYTGDEAVRDAILDGEKTLRSSTHLIEDPEKTQVDYGRLFMVSEPLPVALLEGFDRNDSEQVKTVTNAHQDQLKKVGDWVIFPRTLFHIAQGDFAFDEAGVLHFKGQPIPQGVEYHGDS